MKCKWIMACLTILFAVVLAFLLTRQIACRCGQNDPLAQLKDHSYLVRELGLDETQRQQAAELHAQFAGQLMECGSNHCQARMELMAIILSNDMNDDEAAITLERMCEEYLRSEQSALKHILDLRQILTAGQRQKFDRMLQKTACQECLTCGSEIPPR